MELVFNTKLTGPPERYALKYVNLLTEGAHPFDMSQTTVQIKLGEFEFREANTAVHADIERNGCVSTVDIASGAKIQLPGAPEAQGVLISVDTVIQATDETPSTALPRVLEILHETEKEIFFGLLSGSALEKLGPMYPAKH